MVRKKHEQAKKKATRDWYPERLACVYVRGVYCSTDRQVACPLVSNQVWTGVSIMLQFTV